MDEVKKPLPIGVENFKKLITNEYYYVDKTLLIKDLLDLKGDVNIFTRPRRFGKTLNLSMIKYFFEDTGDDEKNLSRRKLFNGMQIMQAGEKYTKMQCHFPVISLTLKSGKQGSYDSAYYCLSEAVVNEFITHNYVTDALLDTDREKFIKIRDRKATKDEMNTSLAFLSKCLYAYHHKKVIILIDEYDVPLENSYFRGFYQDMVDFIRSLFESALKTNDCLEFAVITGCLRISKESIFTGLNHLEINSILSKNYGEYFGFTPDEAEQMLAFYELSGQTDTLRKWYNGYLFGNNEIYNPWSVIKYVKEQNADYGTFPKAYWSNTSSNDIVKHMIERADSMVKYELETLIGGGTIEKPVHEEITYEDIYKTHDNLWNFLFFTGYLKKVSERFEINTIYITMKIPNEEIRFIYDNNVREWFREELNKQDFHDFYDMLKNGDTDGMQKVIKSQLGNTISFMDSAENFYHGFMTGLLSQSRAYIVKSNRESGNGRGDIFVFSPDREETAYIFELKTAKNVKHAEDTAKKAVKQIVDMDYASELIDMGYEDICMYGIAFFQKNCRICYGGKV